MRNQINSCVEILFFFLIRHVCSAFFARLQVSCVVDQLIIFLKANVLRVSTSRFKWHT